MQLCRQVEASLSIALSDKNSLKWPRTSLLINNWVRVAHVTCSSFHGSAQPSTQHTSYPCRDFCTLSQIEHKQSRARQHRTFQTLLCFISKRMPPLAPVTLNSVLSMSSRAQSPLGLATGARAHSHCSSSCCSSPKSSSSWSGPRHLESLDIAKQVRFCNSVKVRKTRHLNDYTDYQIHACWYSKGERKAIERDAQLQVRRMDSGMLEADSEDCCTRGLRNSAQAQQRQALRSLAIETVLREQRCQRERGSSNQELIAELYEDVTSTSRASSRAIALKDELAVL